jgi:C4-dicarboxylate-specific signal transduction histidine kinase
MIMHSNTGTGKHILTNINEICDQSANMVSYTASNIATGCTVNVEKSLDPSLPYIPIIPRDLSKALINLINNAYWEVDRKWKLQPEQFIPRIIIRTSSEKQRIVVEILDNGDGINEEFSEKIFEPFFSTKPTGQGVGLGLSISNDIIRAHGGSITMSRITDESKKELLTAFKISLPV